VSKIKYNPEKDPKKRVNKEKNKDKAAAVLNKTMFADVDEIEK
jgi:hypothetical protein